MANLVAMTPAQGMLPLSIGSVSIEEVDCGPITSVSPFKDQQRAVHAALKEAIGIGFSAAGRAVQTETSRCIWVGRGEALLTGIPCPNLPGAACVDQSDAWCVVRLSGPDSEAVLSRLIPIDLRRDAFRRNSSAKTLIGHMTGSVTRVGPDAFEVFVFRSMAETLVEELTRVASAIAARRKAEG